MAELELLASVETELKDNADVQLHIGAAAGTARIVMLEFPRMNSGQRQMTQLRLAQPLAITPGDRFVIRGPTRGSDRSNCRFRRRAIVSVGRGIPFVHIGIMGATFCIHLSGT